MGRWNPPCGVVGDVPSHGVGLALGPDDTVVVPALPDAQVRQAGFDPRRPRHGRFVPANDRRDRPRRHQATRTAADAARRGTARCARVRPCKPRARPRHTESAGGIHDPEQDVHMVRHHDGRDADDARLRARRAVPHRRCNPAEAREANVPSLDPPEQWDPCLGTDGHEKETGAVGRRGEADGPADGTWHREEGRMPGKTPRRPWYNPCNSVPGRALTQPTQLRSTA